MVNIDERQSGGCTVWCMKLVLLLTNLFFLCIGGMIVASGIWLSRSGWADVLPSAYGTANAIWALIGFGLIVSLIASVGCFGVISSKRCLLCTYSVFVTIATIIFLILTGTAVFMALKSKGWRNESFPADSAELKFSEKLNAVYCIGESSYYCNDLPAAETIRMFFGMKKSADFVHKMVNVNGTTCTDSLVQICKKKDIVEQVGISEICVWCGIVTKYPADFAVTNWVNKQFKPTNVTALACQKLIMNGSTSLPYDTLPYSNCRGSFLLLVYRQSLYASIACAAFTLYTIIILLAAFKLMRDGRYGGTPSEREPLVGRA